MNPVGPTSAATPVSSAELGDRLTTGFAHPTISTAADATLVSIPDYEILAELGRGGMGVVYQARDLKLNRIVAVKMVIGGGLASPNSLARFLTEAKALAALDHRNIVHVYDRGQYQGLPYFVMEYCSGGSLSKRSGDNAMPPRDAAQLVEQLARGVAAAHATNILHRDLKPDNVLFSADGTPKISDFGLAKRFDESGESETGLTLSGMVMGTPSYMAPEQAIGDSKRVGPAADVYALGAILCKLLTGRPPFLAGNPAETIRQVIQGDPTSPAKLVPNLPRDIVTICLKCLQTMPAKRYASANELADDLGRFLDGRPIHARPVGSFERATKWVKRNPWVTGLAMAAVLALIGGTTVSYVKFLDAKEQEGIAKTNEGIAKQNAKDADDARKKETERVEERDYQLGIGDFLLAVAAYDNRDVPLALERLNRVPLAQRQWEWHYLRRLCDGGIFTIRGHTDMVDAVAVSPDGKRIATGGHDKTVRICDARTGSLLHVLVGHTDWVTSIAFSPDGRTLATAARYDKTVRFWDCVKGTRVGSLIKHPERIAGLAFDPSGSALATVGDDGIIRIWNISNGGLVREMNADRKDATSVAYSPDGTKIASGTLTQVATIWDARAGVRLRQVSGGRQGVSTTHVAFSPDGTRLVGGGGKQSRAQVWDVESGRSLLELGSHLKAITSVCFSPDGTRIATGSYDALARIWNARTGNLVLELKGHTSHVTGVAFSSDGERLVTSSGDKTVKVWDAQSGVPVVEMTRHIGPVLGAAFRSEREVMTISSDNTVQAWSADSGDRRASFIRGAFGNIKKLAVSPAGDLFAVVNADNFVTICDANSGAAIRNLDGHRNRIGSIAFSPDGSLLATGGDDQIAKIWDVASGQLRFTLVGHQESIDGLAFDSGVRLATASVDKTVRLWNVETGQPNSQLKPDSFPVGAAYSCVAFSPDGKSIVAGGTGKTLTIWNTETLEQVKELRGHTDVITCVKLSPNGERIVSGGEDQTVRVWDVRTGTPLLELKGHSDRVTGVDFSRDGARLVTSSYDFTARVWDSRWGTLSDGQESWNGNEFEYRMMHTGSSARRCNQAYLNAREMGDDFAVRFHIERWLALEPNRVALYKLRDDRLNDPRLIARTGFHHREFAKSRIDKELLTALAVSGDRLARRVIAQQLMREGKLDRAIPLLYDCMLLRPIDSPPVEELLLAITYHVLKRPDDAKRLHRCAAEWLDRMRLPQQVANAVTHASNPWAAVGYAFSPVGDPRYRSADWESWYECEVFRRMFGSLSKEK